MVARFSDFGRAFGGYPIAEFRFVIWLADRLILYITFQTQLHST